jgi:chromosomal replication initiation ATPase DnaA
VSNIYASVASARRCGGSVLNNAVQKAYRERVAAGLIKPQEERKPVVLISTNGGRLVEAGDGVTVAEPVLKDTARKEPIRRLIGDIQKEAKRDGKVYPKISWIIEATARYFDLLSADLVGPSRKKRETVPRHIAMYLAIEMTIRSTTQIGVVFGGRDHTTILHGVEKAKRRMAEDQELATKVGILRQIILNGMYVGGNDNGGALG